MDQTNQTYCTAFNGFQRITSGELAEVALIAKKAIDRREPTAVLIFDDSTGRVVDVDYRGTPDELSRRLSGATAHGTPASDPSTGEDEAPRGPGRPKLGVVAREVTLLPRHWDWLNEQPGGASVTLRRLVDQARHANEGKDRIRRSQEAANRFMSAMAGDLVGFEDATRALFAGDRSRFDELVALWPDDIRDYASTLAGAAFGKLGDGGD